VSVNCQSDGGIGDRRRARGLDANAVCASHPSAVDLVLAGHGWRCAGHHEVLEVHVCVGWPNHADGDSGHDHQGRLMLTEIDQALSTLLSTQTYADERIRVDLEAPTKDWAARRTGPVLNLFLNDIREDTQRRTADIIEVKDEKGIIVARRPAERTFMFSYALSAWTSRPEDDHALLGAALANLLRREYLPEDLVRGHPRGVGSARAPRAGACGWRALLRALGDRTVDRDRRRISARHRGHSLHAHPGGSANSGRTAPDCTAPLPPQQHRDWGDQRVSECNARGANRGIGQRTESAPIANSNADPIGCDDGFTVAMSAAGAAPALSTHTPAVATQTSTPGIDGIITDIVRLLAGEGAGIDSSLVVVEADGHLALATHAGEQGEPFIRLPRPVLIPVEALTWSAESTDVQLLDGADSLSAVQQALLELHIAMWNATDKLATFRATHPRSAALRDTALRDAISRIRPTFAAGESTEDMLRTRTFSLRSGASASSVVMPILELADHHPYGAPYALTDEGLSANYHFINHSGLSYVRYGPHRDAFDLACLYGYATDFTTFFVSAPMTLDLKDFGTFTIERSVNRNSGAMWRVDDGRLTVNYLVLDAHTGLFDALHRPVREYLLSRGASKAQAISLAVDVADTVLNTNYRYLLDVIDAARANVHAGAETLALAAQHQCRVIDVIGELA
jgi:hypothetical protein